MCGVDLYVNGNLANHLSRIAVEIFIPSLKHCSYWSFDRLLEKRWYRGIVMYQMVFFLKKSLNSPLMNTVLTVCTNSSRSLFMIGKGIVHLMIIGYISVHHNNYSHFEWTSMSNRNIFSKSSPYNPQPVLTMDNLATLKMQ